VKKSRGGQTQQSGTTAARLQQLHEEGMQPQHLALLAETIIRTRARRPQQADLVDLVWTGPETLGVTNRDTGVVVRDLFTQALRHVLIVGFAVHQGREVFRKLAERMEEVPDLTVQMFLDIRRHPTDTTQDSDLIQRFLHEFATRQWLGPRLPELYYDPRSLSLDKQKLSALHAKCIVIDHQMAFVSSANFTEAAQKRNIEVGALIHAKHFAYQLAQHFQSLAAAHVLQPGSCPRDFFPYKAWLVPKASDDRGWPGRNSAHPGPHGEYAAAPRPSGNDASGPARNASSGCCRTASRTSRTASRTARNASPADAPGDGPAAASAASQPEDEPAVAQDFTAGPAGGRHAVKQIPARCHSTGVFLPDEKAEPTRRTRLMRQRRQGPAQHDHGWL